jgi:hypothetical protein
MATPSRTRDLAAIHATAKQIGMADDTYRDMLWTVARVRSAKDLDFAGRRRVLDHLRAVGGKFVRPNEWAFVEAAPKDRQPLLWKIRAVCKAIGVKKTYAEGVARRCLTLGQDVIVHLGMLSPGQLWVVAGVLQRTKEWGGPAKEAAEMAKRGRVPEAKAE